jgi:hypothetical protein
MDGYLERKLGESTEEGKLTKVTVASGQHVEGLQIAIIQSARIRGRVRDESGLPLGNFPVQLFLPDNVESVVAKVNSGPDGSFDLIGFLPGTFVLVAGSVLSEDPLGSFAATVVASTPDVVLQDVSLSRARYGIRGTVTFKETSKPPADVRVTITSAPRAGLRMADLIEPPASYDLTSGSFEIPSLSPGFYRLDGRLPENLPTCGAINVVVSSRDVSGVPLIVTQCAPGN